MWERLKGWCGHSVTIAWAYVLIVAGSVMDVLPSLADLLNQPELSQALTAAFPDRTVRIYTVVVGLITLAARMRTARRCGDHEHHEEHRDV